MRSSKNSAENTIKFLWDYETKTLLEQIEKDTSIHALRNKAIFLIAKYCALRASEVGLIQINDYNPQEATIYIRRLKGSQSNTLKIVDKTVLSVLNDYYDMRIHMDVVSSALFVSQFQLPINRRTLDTMIKNYCKNTNIPEDKRHFHVLKHTRAMELINLECQLQDVQWYLGHKSITNTMIYLCFTTTRQQRFFNYLAHKEGGK